MSNDKKQTAVDLFHDKVNELIVGKKTITSNDLGKIWLECKEMEREQIIDALLFGDVLSPNTAETYYKQTYGGNK